MALPAPRGNVSLHQATPCPILAGMTEPNPPAIKRATQRPAPFAKPAHWTTDPAPQPGPGSRHEDEERPDPTRFGDWEKNGIAIDF